MKENTLLQLKRRFGIIGNAPALHHALQVASQLGPTNLSILLQGENGSGKESFAKIIHHLSRRKHERLITINCGAIPEGTVNSELFGHEKGAFTDAIAARKGYFEEADGGTIFLEEIGELPLSTQARLLRILEYGEYIKVGSSAVQKSDVRIIAATHNDLLQAITAGRFREDLYYRISTVPIQIPPLRERREDIFLLFRKFAIDFAEQYQTQPIRLAEDAQRLLDDYHFPGNIRQLKNIAFRIAALEHATPLITAQTLTRYLPTSHYYSAQSAIAVGGRMEGDQELVYGILRDMQREIRWLKERVMEMQQYRATVPKELTQLPPALPLRLPAASAPTQEREKGEENLNLAAQEHRFILRALARYNQSRKRAAAALGISERTLYRKIEEYQIKKG
jgi:transcriptional regulator with PAS, ATPase and Fis domain